MNRSPSTNGSVAATPPMKFIRIPGERVPAGMRFRRGCNRRNTQVIQRVGRARLSGQGRLVLREPYGNPSSGHWAGSSARKAIDNARMQVAGLLGCKAQVGMGAIRFSLGRTTTREEIETVIEGLCREAGIQ